MTNLGVTALFAMVAVGGDSYADAHKETTETGRPMVVMVGADWCPACQVMKNTILPEVRKRGILRKVAFALVNLDREGELGGQLTGNGPIPQLLVYRRTADGWRLRRLIGGQDVQTVEKFINEGVQENSVTRVVKDSVPTKGTPPVKPPSVQLPKAPAAEHTADQGPSGGNG